MCWKKEKFPESDLHALSTALAIDSEIVSLGEGNKPAWPIMYKYSWSQRALDDLQSAMFDGESALYHNKMFECISNFEDVNTVASWPKCFSGVRQWLH